MPEIMSYIEARKALAEKPKRHKYGAKKVKLDGYVFDSKAEAAEYATLKIRERAGEINAIFVQHRFDLHATDNHGVKRKIGAHFVDFSFWDVAKRDRSYVEVKGRDLPLGKWKRHHAEAEHGIKIEVVRGRNARIRKSDRAWAAAQHRARGRAG